MSLLVWSFVSRHKYHIFPLEPEIAMSIFAYDPFGKETTYFCMLVLCQMGRK